MGCPSSTIIPERIIMPKRIRRLIGGIFIITAIIFTQIPPRLSEAASVAKEDFLMDNFTLTEYTGTANTVSVSDEIKAIGEEAFANNPYLTAVHIGKNVKEIRHGAFANCTDLTRMVIPNNVTDIGSAAFSGCTSLMNVSIGSGVEKIGEGVFAGCRNLAGISVSPKNNKLSYQTGVLYDKDKKWIYAYLSGNQFAEYHMPNSVEHISPYSFWGNEILSDVYLSSFLNEVPAYAFSNCKNLRSVQIPYSVNYIDVKAFENCVNLTDVIIPGSVSYISPTAFDGCPKLNIIADEGTYAYDYFNNLERSDVQGAEDQDTPGFVYDPDNRYEGGEVQPVTPSPDNVYDPSSGLIDASRDPSNVDWMPSVSPFYDDNDTSVFGKTIIVGGKAVFFIDREMDVKQIERDTVGDVSTSDTAAKTENTDQNEDIAGSEGNDASENIVYDSSKGGYLPKYTLVDNKIAAQAYYASKNTDELKIPEGTVSVGDFSFARSSIESIGIPSSVERIGYGAFYHCDRLKDVSIPSSVKYIDGYAFENTPFLNDIKSSNENFYIVGDGILLAYGGSDESVSIPDGVKTVAAGCFSDNKKIRSVVIPDSCTVIDSDAFRDCTSLTKVEGAKGLETIGDRAFMGCPLESVTIAASVKSIGLKAFDMTGSSKADNTKVVSFEGSTLPKVSADDTSMRLSNDDYRKDALFGVLYAIVPDDVYVSNLSKTVLDSDTLGFSGLVVKIDKEADEKPGEASVVASHIYSSQVLEKIPSSFIYEGKEYDIKGFGNISVSVNPYSDNKSSKKVNVIYNGSENDKAIAEMSQDEVLGDLYIDDSSEAAAFLTGAYSELFGYDTVDIKGLDIRLKDASGNFDIKRLGHSKLYITVPVDLNGNTYHVITSDSDGQLEELVSSYDENKKTISFETDHLSYFGIYAKGPDNVTLKYKDGKLVKNYRLDASPDTGDKSFSVFYVYALLLLSVGLLLIFVKRKA